MRPLWLIATIVPILGASSTAACTSEQPAGGGGGVTIAATVGATQASSITASSSYYPETNAYQVDEPTMASLTCDFTIIDDGDGSFSAEGLWWIEYLPRDDGGFPYTRCVEAFAFVADLNTTPPDGSGWLGCDENGSSCTPICPFDDPSDTATPSGTCLGHFSNLVGNVSSYATDCNFEDPTGWFHPHAGDLLPLLEQFLFSAPIEDALPTGVPDPATWSAFADQLESSMAGAARALQVQFVNRNPDGSWSNEGSLFGITVSSDQPAPAAPAYVGHHANLNLLTLTFEPAYRQ